MWAAFQPKLQSHSTTESLVDEALMSDIVNCLCSLAVMCSILYSGLADDVFGR